MARMRRKSSGCHVDSENTLLESHHNNSASPATNNRRSPRKKNVKIYVGCFEDGSNSEIVDVPHLKPKQVLVSPGKQIRLTPLKSIGGTAISGACTLDAEINEPIKIRRVRSPIKRLLDSTTRQLPGIQQADMTHDDEARIIDLETEIEESVWCGSEASSSSSEDDLPSPRKLIHFQQPRQGTGAYSADFDFAKSLDALQISVPAPVLPKSLGSRRKQSASTRPTSSSDKENDERALLRFSPPRLHTLRKQTPLSRPSTPPPSPTKGKLQSPSKRAARVPTPPLRQSLDAFWNAETVNEWNEQYSPRKEWSPRKTVSREQSDSTSPTGSPRKLQSPSKRTKAEMTAKREWESRKRQVAQDFLVELDDKITNGQIRQLSASTGGVHFIWSKTLNTTAGRANWRRETTRSKHSDGTVSLKYKNHASIELAEKVIDDEERLLNVIAHEFCHLANFMISGIKDHPHGMQFKEWGRQCTRAFANRGVEVTTKHSYQIDYKYIWRCSNEDCGAEFKRHSKSIDLARHTCGSCRSKLVQIKPVPRRGAATRSDGGVTGYAAYVKQHFAAAKAELPARATHKEVMKALGRRYRAEKATMPAEVTATQSDKVPLTNILLSSSSSDLSSGGRMPSSAVTSQDVDKVVRMLNFVKIGD